MSVLKKGVRFASQDTDFPMLEEEIPLLTVNLTPAGIRNAALVGCFYLRQQGYSINKVLEILDTKSKERQ
jgi:hypothetical protein